MPGQSKLKRLEHSISTHESSEIMGKDAIPLYICIAVHVSYSFANMWTNQWNYIFCIKRIIKDINLFTPDENNNN